MWESELAGDVTDVAGEWPTGKWRYIAWRPAAPSVVDTIWCFDGPTLHRRKRILPNGMLEILVNFSAPYRLVEGRGEERLGAVWIGGLLSAAQVIEQPDRQNVLGVRLRPAGARALFPQPLRELTDLQVDLHHLLGRAAAELAERCHAAPSPRQRFRVAAHWVAERVRRSAELDPAIAWSEAAIRTSMGAVPIAALREGTGLSKARLVSGFRDCIGVTPKLYARVVRFQKLTEILQNGAAGLVEAALDAGYYDQPHMNADFRALAGLTPTQFIASRHPVGDGNTAAERV